MRVIDDRKQAVTREHSACAIEGTQALVIRFRGHTPHWKAYANGGYARAQFEYQGKPETPQLFIRQTEGYETEAANGGTRFVEKETMLTLDNAAARELYAFLRERFEPK